MSYYIKAIDYGGYFANFGRKGVRNFSPDKTHAVSYKTKDAAEKVLVQIADGHEASYRIVSEREGEQH